jgi:hypothetical protein
VIKRYALKDQALQPKPESLGAAQVELAEKTGTALNASCPQSGQGAQPLGLVLGLFADRKSLFACTSPSFYKPREYWRDSALPHIAVVPVAAGSRLTFFARAKESKQRNTPSVCP